MFRLKDECSSINTILDQVKYRSDWIKYQEAQRRKEEEELEKERGRCECVISFIHSEEIITLIRSTDLCARGLVAQGETIFVITNVALDGLVVSVLASGPKVRGFNPGRGRWIFKGDKNP
jgi:hypothetical protein